MKIVILATATPSTGGIGEYVRRVLPHVLPRLCGKGYRSVVLLSPESTVRCEPYGARGVYLPKARRHRVGKVAVDNLYSWLASWKGDVFVTLQSVLPLVPLRSRRTLAVIHELRQLSGVLYGRLGPAVVGSGERYWRTCLRRTIRMADRCVAVSDYVLEELRTIGEVPSERLAKACEGVDRSLFRPISDQGLRDSVRRRYRLPDRFYIFVGGITRGWKNLELVARAYGLPEKTDIRLPVVITSSRPASAAEHVALKMIEQNGLQCLFQFVGRVADEDLPVIYSMATALIFPSHYEGFGLPPLEAMACGTPVVASNCTSLPEVIGDAGILIDPMSPESLLSALQNVNDEPVRRRLIPIGFERVQQFTWERAGEELATEIISLGSRQPTPN